MLTQSPFLVLVLFCLFGGRIWCCSGIISALYSEIHPRGPWQPWNARIKPRLNANKTLLTLSTELSLWSTVNIFYSKNIIFSRFYNATVSSYSALKNKDVFNFHNISTKKNILCCKETFPFASNV